MRKSRRINDGIQGPEMFKRRIEDEGKPLIHNQTPIIHEEKFCRQGTKLEWHRKLSLLSQILAGFCKGTGE